MICEPLVLAGAQMSHGRKRHATVSPLLNVKDVGDRLALAVHVRKPDQGAQPVLRQKRMVVRNSDLNS